MDLRRTQQFHLLTRDFSLFDSIDLADGGHPGRGLHATVRFGTTAT
jgi:hypothetical protein